tara:strand:+ start:774 stop:1013 length:240 start_codon:yes stop_codon:yes gene_type:complete
MLTEKDLDTLNKIRDHIMNANSNIAECSDLWLSDVRRLADIPWQLDALIRNNTPKKVSSWKELKPESKGEDEPSGWEEN